MKSPQKILFVVDKELDIKNHFIGLNSYKKHNFQQKNERIEKLLKLDSKKAIRKEIEKFIEQFYKKEDKLDSLVKDVNNEWTKIEKAFFLKLEAVHKFPFPQKSVKGVLSSANRFGYHTGDRWFATDMFRNKFICIDTATHELMHFMFHKYYDKVCKQKGLSKDQMWDVKESFTVLLNIEFNDFRFQFDNGYPPHKELRETIKKSWLKNHDFDIVLSEAIEFVKSS